MPRLPQIGITAGDPCGIGPEVIVKSLKNSSIHRLAEFTLIGPASVLKKKISPQNRAKIVVVDPCPELSSGIRPGRPNAKSACASLFYLQSAASLLKSGTIDGLVTGPVSKEAICGLGIPFVGHTEFLAESFRVKNFEMMFVSPTLKTVIVTRHISVRKIPAALTKTKILSTIRLTHQTLGKLFGIRRPMIGVCGLNPHAGEGGEFGNEEIRTIIPAIKKARQEGIRACGPLSADTVFIAQHAEPYDAIVAMYHDQGLIAVKTVYFRQVVNLTIGLPFIRTSPAHGTAFDIAGKNKADAAPMSAAIKLAAQLTRRVLLR